MLELLVIFQLQVDKKTMTTADTMVSVPKWLSHTDVLDLVKNAVAAIAWAWAILNIINMDVVNPPKFVAPAPMPVAVAQEGRKHSSFAIRKEESRNGGKYNSQRSERKFGSAPRTDAAPREEGRGGFVSREWWSRDRPSGGGWYKGKNRPAGWGWFKWRSSRPARSGR